MNKSHKEKPKQFHHKEKKQPHHRSADDVPAIDQPATKSENTLDQTEKAALYGKRKGLGFEDHM
jgi:hypothetical protein